MIEKKEWKGEWNFPGKTETCKGLLTYDPLEGARLELYGIYESGQGRPIIGIITGKTTNGYVTLVDTRYDSGQFSNETKTGYALYIPSFILCGHAFLETTEVKFSSVQFIASGMRKWIGVDALDIEMNNKKLIEYKRPAAINFDCFEGCQGKIEFDFSGDYLEYPYEINIKQFCTVIFTYNELTPFRTILLDIFKFIGLITLCTYEQSNPLSIELYNENIINEAATKALGQQHLQRVNCFYRNSFYKPGSKKSNIHHYLVNYKDVSNNINTIIPSWFKKSKEESEQVIKLVLHAFIDKYDFHTNKFMDAARAIETFHRQNHNNEVISKEEIKLIKDTIDKTDLTKEQKALVKEKLNFAYEPSLKQRLEEMLRLYSFPYFDEKVSDKDKFIKQVRDARNYYTHFDKKLEKKAPQLKELFDLTENINLILFSAILQGIGIPVESFDQTVRPLVY